jgi:hypothetical protein
VLEVLCRLLDPDDIVEVPEQPPDGGRCRSATTEAASRIASARSARVCALGSPVEPPSEIPCEPLASWNSISRRSPAGSGAPSRANGVTTGAMEPRMRAGSSRNFIGRPSGRCGGSQDLQSGRTVYDFIYDLAGRGKLSSLGYIHS